GVKNIRCLDASVEQLAEVGGGNDHLEVASVLRGKLVEANDPPDSDGDGGETLHVREVGRERFAEGLGGAVHVARKRSVLRPDLAFMWIAADGVYAAGEDDAVAFLVFGSAENVVDAFDVGLEKVLIKLGRRSRVGR